LPQEIRAADAGLFGQVLQGIHLTFVDAARNDVIFKVFDRFSHELNPPDVNA
jgi:hypothetical protein